MDSLPEEAPLSVPVRDEDGTPICPVCQAQVAEAGHFCSPACYQHFTSVVESQQIVVMAEYVDFYDQPWREAS